MILRPILQPILRPILRSPTAAGAGPSPSLFLDFTNGYTDPRITYSGGANGTRVNSAGLIVAATTPRFDYNPVTLAPLGLLVEEQRTNLLLNNTTLSTQNATTAATPYTLSFYGTGTVTLSGTSTAGPLVGTSAYPNRVTLTFTPTAGTLTLTVSGSVQYAQLEAGSFATSVIINAGAALTRTADSAAMTGANFSGWYNATVGTFVAGFDTVEADATPGNVFEVGDGTFNERMNAFISSTPTVNFVVTDGGVQLANFSTGSYTVGTVAKVAAAYELNNFAGSLNGGTPGTDASGTIPTVTALYIGRQGPGGAYLNGHIKTLRYYPQRLPNATLQGMTA